MSLAEAGEIFAYWEENPPAHLALQIIARMLGWQSRKPDAARILADIAAAPPPGLVVTRAGLGMPEPLLDPAALRARNRARAGSSPATRGRGTMQSMVEGARGPRP